MKPLLTVISNWIFSIAISFQCCNTPCWKSEMFQFILLLQSIMLGQNELKCYLVLPVIHGAGSGSLSPSSSGSARNAMLRLIGGWRFVVDFLNFSGSLCVISPPILTILSYISLCYIKQTTHFFFFENEVLIFWKQQKRDMGCAHLLALARIYLTRC